ncbi:hypothetical protein RHGRI_035260 [Rhododendron griersonianum]|uniref:Uncharacterized protein n=1 Tax=Rhododendron griersonianum TaxID=479676 RepID=A0AAV6I4A6_9ERIC|nr:hypothetical protein RHGRI_035260 [Rhododendron griersonianum]
MKKYGVEESWTLLFKVRSFSRGVDWPVGFRMNGELVMETGAASLVSYNPESKQVKDLGIKGSVREEEQFIDSLYLGRYVETLVLLDRVARAPEHMGTTDGSLIM